MQGAEGLRRKPSRFGMALKWILRCSLFLLVVTGWSLHAAPSDVKPNAAVPAVDLQADRRMLTPVAKDWLFQDGDDPRWADPALDDASWKILQPGKSWSAQGLRGVNNLAWLRFRVRVPAKMDSLLLIMPPVAASYQIFADGVLAGQAGRLPPNHPFVPASTRRIFTLPLGRARVVAAGDSKELVVALRVWQDPLLARIAPDRISGTVLVGAEEPAQTMFALLKSQALLVRGNDYTLAVICLIVGSASWVLFLLTHRGFYAWFSLSMVTGALSLPMRLLAGHFSWGYVNRIYVFALLDFISTQSYALFVFAALRLLRWRLVLLMALLGIAAEVGPLLFIQGTLTQTWADGVYFFCATSFQVILIFVLVRGWRRNNSLARLLLLPFAIPAIIATSGNLGHWLLDLDVPHAVALLTADIQLLSDPFSVNLSDLGDMLADLGLLAVLVYQFAQSSREEQRLKSALQTAHDIQHSLVPTVIPMMGGLRAEVVYLAAEEVGGDFCQVLARSDGSTLIVIGDVSGKGLEAAMLGTLAVGALRSIADEGIGPAETMQRLNSVLLRTPNRGFITCLCMLLSANGRIILANAGHLSPYLDGEEVATSPGLPLGLIADVEYEQSSFVLPASARLTLISDGVVEARAANGELYGFARTMMISKWSAHEIAAEAQRFGQEDDITVITLDWQQQALAV